MLPPPLAEGVMIRMPLFCVAVVSLGRSGGGRVVVFKNINTAGVVVVRCLFTNTHGTDVSFRLQSTLRAPHREREEF